MFCWWCCFWWCSVDGVVLKMLCRLCRVDGVVLMMMCWWCCVDGVVMMVLCWWCCGGGGGGGGGGVMEQEKQNKRMAMWVKAHWRSHKTWEDSCREKKLGPLQALTVQTRPKARYESARNGFYDFLKSNQMVPPRKRQDLDPLVSEFIDLRGREVKSQWHRGRASR